MTVGSARQKPGLGGNGIVNSGQGPQDGHDGSCAGPAFQPQPTPVATYDAQHSRQTKSPAGRMRAIDR
jgi:hypothetical protein